MPKAIYKLDEERAETIVLYLRTGAFIETAASAAGISKQTLYSWLRAGRKKGADKKLRKFWRDTREAMAMSEVQAINQIAQAAQDGQWQAAAWHLERKYPDRWGRQRLEVTGKDGAPLDTGIARVTFVLPDNGRRVVPQADPETDKKPDQ